MFLSEHFSLAEATHSQTASRLGIDNEHPGQEVIDAAICTAKNMEILRALLQFPITVSSWIRGAALNYAVGGVPTSQHIKGEAVDFICPAFGTPLDICKRILTVPELLIFDQLILEHTWVHISFSAVPGMANRKQVLSLLQTGKYATGLTDKTGASL